jgi:SAM-dependent methyltransferase
MRPSGSFLPSEYFRRRDERDDAEFYSSPRLVTYINDNAANALSAVFFELLPTKGTYLDLMSGWRSYLSQANMPARIVGLGMNATEMADNSQLDSYIVQDINKVPSLPFDEAEFDAVVCTLSVQYLTRPVEVFQEVNRVLKPDGAFIVAFSTRAFSGKAIAAWLVTTDEQHVQLVAHYFLASGNWTAPKATRNVLPESDPLYVVWASKLSSQDSHP